MRGGRGGEKGEKGSICQIKFKNKNLDNFGPKSSFFILKFRGDRKSVV